MLALLAALPLVGTGTAIGLDFPGPGAARGLQLSGFSTGVRAEHEEVDLTDMSLVNNTVGALGLKSGARARVLHRKALKRLAARLRNEGITPELLRELA